MKIKCLMGLLFLSIIGCSETIFVGKSCGFFRNADGQRTSWSKLPVLIYMNKSMYEDSKGPEYRAAVENAVNTWNSLAPAGKEFFRIVPGSFDLRIYNGCRFYTGGIIIHLEKYWSRWPEWSENVQGMAVTCYNGPRIKGGIIVFNHENYDFFTSNEPVDLKRVDLESLALHELGHTLGLAHYPIPTTVMYEGLARGEVRRDFDADVFVDCGQTKQCVISEEELIKEFLSCEY